MMKLYGISFSRREDEIILFKNRIKKYINEKSRYLNKEFMREMLYLYYLDWKEEYIRK